MSNPVHPIVGPEDYLSPYPDIDYSMGPKIIYGDVDVFTVVLNDALTDQDDEWGRTEQIALRMFIDEIVAIHSELFGYSGILGLQQKAQAVFDMFVGLEFNNFLHPELCVLTIGNTLLSDGTLVIGSGSFLTTSSMSLNNGSFIVNIDPVTLVTSIISQGSNTSSVILDPSATTPVVTLEVVNGGNTTDYIFSSDPLSGFSIPHGFTFNFGDATGINLGVSGDVSCGTLTLNPNSVTTLVEDLLTVGTTGIAATLSDSQLSLNNGDVILSGTPGSEQLTFYNGNQPIENHISGFDLVLGRSTDANSGFSVTLNPATMQTTLSASNTPMTYLVNVSIILDVRDPTNLLGPFIDLSINGTADYKFYSTFFNIPSGKSIIFGDDPLAPTATFEGDALTFNSPSAIYFTSDSSIHFGTNSFINLANDSYINIADGGSISVANTFGAGSSGVWSGDNASPIKWSYTRIPGQVWPVVTGGDFNFNLAALNPNAPDPSKCLTVIVTVTDTDINAIYPESAYSGSPGLRFMSEYFLDSYPYHLFILVPNGATDIHAGHNVTINVLIFYTD